MARTGRPPKPTALKRVQGTLRKHRENPDEWIPPAGAPAVPAHLTDVARSLWRFLVERMTDGILTQVDGVALEGFCVHYARARDADEMVAKKGLLVLMPGGQIQANPALSISRQSWALVDKFGSKLGLSPSDRRNVSSVGSAKPDTIEAFLFRKPLTVVPGGRE